MTLLCLKHNFNLISDERNSKRSDRIRYEFGKIMAEYERSINPKNPIAVEVVSVKWSLRVIIYIGSIIA